MSRDCWLNGAAIIITLLAVFGSPARAEDPDEPVVCPTGAKAFPRYCKYIVSYNKNHVPPPPAIVTTLKLKPEEKTWSVALIAGVSEYPKSTSPLLPPAKVDLAKLRDFAREQAFDAVIYLSEGDVNFNTLAYFMQTFIPNEIQNVAKSRVLFAYSGHGVPGTVPLMKGALVMREAVDPSSSSQLISLGVLDGLIVQLSTQAFQFLVLINSCYGGDMFNVVQGGQDIWEPAKRGADALTAGAPDDVVFSLGGANDGSLFFDKLIEGVETGAAAVSLVSDGAGGVTVQHSDIARLGDFWKYTHDAIQKIATLNHREYSKPWEGSVYPPPATSAGGFFFLSGPAVVATAAAGPTATQTPTPTPSASASHGGGGEIVVGGLSHFGETTHIAVPEIAPPTPTREPTGFNFGYTLPSGPASSAPGRPDIKVFKQPEEYPVRGVDLSHYDGPVDWGKLKAASLDLGASVRFAYMRATMGADRQDKRFKENWETAKEVGIVRGAYHVFDLCQPASAQAENLRMQASSEDREALPIAVDVEYYPESEIPWMKKQAACFHERGPKIVRRELRDFVDAIKATYGKPPIMFGNPKVVTDIYLDEFNDLPLWLHDYSTGLGVSLPGSNPWTFWQYTDQLRVSGVDGPVDANAFYGVDADFEAFRNGAGNIARRRATGEESPASNSAK